MDVRGLLDMGFYDSAISCISLLSNDEPKMTYARYMELAEAYLALKQPLMALEMVEKCRKLKGIKEAERIQLILLKGEIYWLTGKHVPAFESWCELSLHQRSDKVNLRLAQFGIRRKADKREAKRCILEVIEHQPYCLEVLSTFALCGGQWSEIRPLYKQHPLEKVIPLLLQYETAMVRCDGKRAIPLAVDMLAIVPNSVYIKLLLVKAYYSMGDYEQVVHEYKGIMKQHPHILSYIDMYMFSLARTTHYKDMIPLASQLVSQTPLSIDGYLALAAFSYCQHKYEEAYVYCSRATDIDPFQPRAYLMLARVKSRTSNLNDAVQYVSRSLSLSKTFEGYEFLIRLLIRNGTYFTAEESAVSMLRNLSNDRRVLCLACMVYSKDNNDLSSARALINKIGTAGGSSEYLILAEAYVLAREGRGDEVRDKLLEGPEGVSLSGDFFCSSAELLVELGMFSDAITLFNRAAALQPLSDRVKKGLEVCMQKYGGDSDGDSVDMESG